MKIADSLLKLIGNTPLVALSRLSKDCHATIIGKCEFLNPCGSVKDRPGLAMIEHAEKEGLINKDTTIIEPTSGNTGIALAFVAAIKGYNVILTMPDSMSLERRSLLNALGAKIELTPGHLGMKGAIERAQDLQASLTNAVIPQQFQNKANPNTHYLTTAEEIWADTDGKIDIFVAGVGTGGTISGTGKKLKEKNPNIKIIAVEPEDSSVLSGGEPGPHMIQGIGAGFIPSNVDRSIIDEVVTISNDDAFHMSRQLAAQEGILVGMSSGCNVKAAIDIGNRPENKGTYIVTILCDVAERYLSTTLFQ